MKTKVMFSIRIDPDVKYCIEQLAKSERRSVGNYLEGVLLEEINKRRVGGFVFDKLENIVEKSKINKPVSDGKNNKH